MRLPAILFSFLFFSLSTFAQQPAVYDTLVNSAVYTVTGFKVNPFMQFSGKTIRNIIIRPIGFGNSINDTDTGSIATVKKYFGLKIANSLHRNTRLNVIKNNLLFKEGDKLNPYLLADNERYLRDLNFIQDAIFRIRRVEGSTDQVDLVVVVKDVFSLGPDAGIGGTTKFNFGVKDENFAGTGSKLGAGIFFDGKRRPHVGFNAEYINRNIKGSFINWTMGVKTFNNAFNSNRNEENYYYIRFEKPLVSQYLRWLGTLELNYNKTNNGYLTDSLYLSDYRYSFYNVDAWIAYNFGTQRLRYTGIKSTTRKFLALRAFNQHFLKSPNKTELNYDGTYSNSSGMLASFTLFKQNYYRTTYIYGFGRNEDVPQGFTFSLIGGYSIRKDSLNDQSRTRPYYGFEMQRSKYNEKGFYSFYTLKLGGYRYQRNWEDFDLLVNVDHFTRLRPLNSKWYSRFFLSGGITKQFKPVLEQALLLRSQYGLPYFEFGNVAADFRGTVKTEAVFYRIKKLWGFGFAPFLFGDAALLKPTNENISKSDLYSAVGGGFRIRNENLIFGTIEARFSYFPRIVPFMNHFKIKFNTNLRYKYNNSFYRRPDFVLPNL